MSNFQTIQNKFSLGDVYDLNIIKMKINSTNRILKHFEDTMFQN